MIGIIVVIVLLIAMYVCFKRWWSRRGDKGAEKKGLKATVDLKNMQLLGSSTKEKVDFSLFYWPRLQSDWLIDCEC